MYAPILMSICPWISLALQLFCQPVPDMFWQITSLVLYLSLRERKLSATVREGRNTPATAKQKIIDLISEKER